MRILSVGNMYPPHHLGGYELVWRSATRFLREAGHEARVLTTDHRRPAALGADDDPDVHRELQWYWREHGWPRLGPRARLALERHNAQVFDRHVDELRPDVVAWWAMGGMSLSLVERARRAGIPAVGFVHDDWLYYGPLEDRWLRMVGRASWLAPAIERATGIPARVDLPGAAEWVFVSKTTRGRAAGAGMGSLADSEVLPSGIEERFAGAPAPERPWHGRLLYVGRLDPRKGVETAIRALAELPQESRLDVVGEGDPGELDRLERLVAAIGLAERVDFLGARPREELRDLYTTSDAVVFPVEWDEPWGLVPLEAMAVGRPVLATGRGGSAEYLRDGENCLLFPAGDAGALAAAVRRLADDAPLRARLGADGGRTAATHLESTFNRGVEEALAKAAAR